MSSRNFDARTVAGFGDEWARFDQSTVPLAELERVFNSYFARFPWSTLGKSAEGFDMGCGSGRWARFVSQRVTRLHCVDASAKALDVARHTLRDADNCVFHVASVDETPLPDDSMDFGYSLGVLHHIPDTQQGIHACVRMLKPGAPFLIYLYYRFDNRPAWFRTLWRISDLGRRAISRLPIERRHFVTDVVAASVYLPLARIARALENRGVPIGTFPLSAYRHSAFTTMRTDALDRFGTSIEKRFTREEIERMLTAAGLERLTFHDPYWCAVGFKR